MGLFNNFVIPEQRIVATPSDFVFNDFGKNNPEMPKHAIRLSRVINKLINAFKEDNSILRGYILSNFKYTTNSDFVEFNLGKGEAILDSTFVELPFGIDVKWEGLKDLIPYNVTDGRLVIGLKFNYSSFNMMDRPIRQNHQRSIIPSYPLEHVGFNPMMIIGGCLVKVSGTENTYKFVNDDPAWDLESDNFVLITSQLYYSRTSSELKIFFNNELRGDVINIQHNKNASTIVSKIYDEQMGGPVSRIERVDGGDLDDVEEELIPTVGIRSIYNKQVKLQTVSISPIDVVEKNNLYVFQNGLYYSRNIPQPDYSLGNDDTLIRFRQLVPAGSTIQIFEPLEYRDSNTNELIYPKNKVLGYIETIYDAPISFTSGNVNSTENSVTINNIHTYESLLVLYNGVLYQKDVDFTIATNKIIFNDHIVLIKDHSLTIINVVSGTGNQPSINIVFDGPIVTEGYTCNIFGISPSYSYLVWYNGLLYRSQSDYIVYNNYIEFRHIKLVKDSILKVIQV